jgi:hypothetical protein
VEGYDIPVLNEREIRASAGMLFGAMFLALMFVSFQQNFVPIKYVITMFLTEFIIRVFVSPKYAPSLIVGRWFVRNQVPEYVGAQQKKFAWTIGLGLASLVFTLLVVFNGYSPVTGISCLICLVFLFFESVFGICLGCKFYELVYKEKAQHCPGEVCDPHKKTTIQKTSWLQVIVVVAALTYTTLTVVVFHNELSKKPYDMFGISNSAQSKE